MKKILFSVLQIVCAIFGFGLAAISTEMSGALGFALLGLSGLLLYGSLGVLRNFKFSFEALFAAWSVFGCGFLYVWLRIVYEQAFWNLQFINSFDFLFPLGGFVLSFFVAFLNWKLFGKKLS